MSRPVLARIAHAQATLVLACLQSCTLQILRSECAFVSVLDLPGLHRLCEILGLPERCAQIWQARCDELRCWLNEPGHVEELQCEVVVQPQVQRAFSKWLSEKSSSKLDRCFVQQTICCATILLRRVFRETSVCAQSHHLGPISSRLTSDWLLLQCHDC